MVKIGIIFPTDISLATKIYAEISEWIDDPNTHFLFSDEHPILARYLHQIQYRKCTIYHIGDTSKHNIGKYRHTGGFISYAEIEATLREVSDEIIEIPISQL